MRAFVILSIIAVTSAGRLGYNYQPIVSASNDFVSSGSGISPLVAVGSGLGVSGGPGVSFVSDNTGFASDFGGQVVGSGIRYGISGGSIGGGINIGSAGQLYGSGLNVGSGPLVSGVVGGGLVSGINYGSSGLVGGGISYEPVANRVIDGGLSKEYYTFSAPEEPAQLGQISQGIDTLLKKNLRVIFIKAPENNGVFNAALQIAKQATEDRTAIYVLSKEPDVSEIATQVQQINENVRGKPEVRFIKYRTAEDAINAQSIIQQQYEALGGSSQSSNEGVVPILNFASPPVAVHRHIIDGGVNVLESGSAITSSDIGSPVVSLVSPSEQIVDLGNSGLPSNSVVVKTDNGYLPPAVKK